MRIIKWLIKLGRNVLDIALFFFYWLFLNGAERAAKILVLQGEADALRAQVKKASTPVNYPIIGKTFLNADEYGEAIHNFMEFHVYNVKMIGGKPFILMQMNGDVGWIEICKAPGLNDA